MTEAEEQLRAELKLRDDQWKADLMNELKLNTSETMKLRESFIEHCKGEEAIVKELAEVRTEVYGNGKPGNKTDITNLKAAVKSLWKVLGGAWAVILALIPVVATIVWEIAKAAARKGP